MSAHLYEAVESDIIEQRREPRFSVVKPVRLEGLTGELRNISQSGAQIYCLREFAEPLRAIVNNEKLTLEIDFDSTVDLTVQVVYAQKTDTGYLMGLRFLSRADPGRRHVKALIATL